MKVTIDLPEPNSDNIEQKLVEEFSHLVSVLKGMLGSYKSQGIEVPTISLRLPGKYKKVAEISESKKFVEDLLTFHINRIPTANVPANRQVLKQLYEAGHTDPVKLLALYQENLATYPLTSWLTVKYNLTHQKSAAETKQSSDSIDFQRVEPSEEAIEQLKNRIKGLDTDAKN